MLSTSSSRPAPIVRPALVDRVIDDSDEAVETGETEPDAEPDYEEDLDQTDPFEVEDGPPEDE
jgi:hypothetical protein